MNPRRLLACLAAAVISTMAPARPPATRSLSLDRSSRIVIAVGKSGAFSFAGHTHEVTGPIGGTVTLDADDIARSQIALTIDAKALVVSVQGEPAGDAAKVQQVMLSDKVLDVEHHPQITFRSTAITVKSAAMPAVDLVVTGTLLLHGVSRTVTVPVHAEVTDPAVTARGAFSIKQTDFAIKPISVAGAVSVKDALNITFTIAARP